MANYRVIQECPVNAQLAPYLYTVISGAHAVVNSIYRGEDPEAVKILHKYGHHTQAEIFYEYEHGEEPNPANPPGYSTHELKSDGAAYPRFARGISLPWWAQGFDVNDNDVERCIEVAGNHGWVLFRPYSSGSEYHHLNFRVEPTPNRHASRLYLAKVRRKLPKS